MEINKRLINTKLQMILETAMDSILTIDQDHIIRFANRAAIDMFGYSEEELIGKNVNILIPKQVKNHGHLINKFGSSSSSSRLMNKGGNLNAKSKSGKLIPIETALSKMQLDGMIFYNAIIRDVTDKVEAEKLIKESEEKFRGIFNSMTDVFTRLDIGGKCLMVSPSVYEITGYKPEEIIGRKFSEFYVKPQLRKILEQKLQEKGSVHNFEIEILKKDGSIIIVSSNIKMCYDSEGKPNGIDSIFRDVTQKNKVAKALQESENNLVKAQEVAYIGSWKVDLIAKDILLSNENYRIFGVDKETKMTYHKFLEKVHPEDRDYVDNKWNKALKGEPYDIQHRLLLGDEVRWVREKAELNFDGQGNAVSAHGITQDITGQKQVELQILQYQKRLKDLATDLTLAEEKARKKVAIDLHDDVGQLLSSSRMQLSTISHEMNQFEFNKKIKNISKDLLLALQATRDVIFDLSPPQLNEIGLYAATHDWMKQQIELKYGIKTSITRNKKKCQLNENAKLLVFRSLRELMINVAKHAEARNLNIDIKKKMEMLEITVQDDGVGFDWKSALSKVEKPGYGLFSVQESISDIGGSWEIDSAPGKGTRITIRVPLNKTIL
jgi:PAS domain S-box-containing protein